MTVTRLDCVHCGYPVEVPEVVSEDDLLWCIDCNGANIVMIDDDNIAYFQVCEDVGCIHCAPDIDETEDKEI